MQSTLNDKGYALWAAPVDPNDRELLRASLFQEGAAGTRCLLDIPIVGQVAGIIGRNLIDQGILPTRAVAIQAITFDKSAAANWKVTWHQDLMFPFARPVTSDGYCLASVKDGVNFARPPLDVLEELLAVRLHLDECNEENGPLRVVPRSHSARVIPGAEIQSRIASHGEAVCTAQEGEALLMRPLLLHASSKAVLPRHRRVLHLVFHSGRLIPEKWYRAISPSELVASG